MSSNATHDKTSAGSSLVRELNALFKQRSHVDRMIARLESRFLTKVASQAHLPMAKGARSPYPERMENENKLIEAIPLVMRSGKKMRTQQICDALQKTGAYKSNGERFYAMVNVRLSNLIKDKNSAVERVGRGLYQLRGVTSKTKGKKTIST